MPPMTRARKLASFAPKSVAVAGVAAAIAVAGMTLAAGLATAKATNVLIPTQDEAVETIQISHHKCAGSRSGETGVQFHYGRAATTGSDYVLFDRGDSENAGRYLARICIKRLPLATGDKRVSQGAVELKRDGRNAYVLQEGQCVLMEAGKLSIALKSLPVMLIGDKEQKQQIKGTMCLNAVGR